MPIDLGQVDWLYVVVLTLFVFVSNIVANLLSFNRRIFSAVLAAAVFATIYIFWTYYPHGLPLPTTITTPKSPVTEVPPAATNPQRPRNPVTDITPSTNTSR
jgi:hypothetical protein